MHDSKITRDRHSNTEHRKSSKVGARILEIVFAVLSVARPVFDVDVLANTHVANHLCEQKSFGRLQSENRVLLNASETENGYKEQGPVLHFGRLKKYRRIFGTVSDAKGSYYIHSYQSKIA